MRTNPANIVYNPNEVATLGQSYIAYKRDHKEFGVPFPVTKMREKIYPLFPGEVMTLIARPGHAKTGLMMAWARQRARQLKEISKDRMAIYATWEQSVEELHTFHVAAEQGISVTRMAKGDIDEEHWEKAMTASAQRVSEPLWFIGHSVMRKSGRKPITIETLAQALESIQADGFVVDCVFLDYLQRIQPEGRTDNPVMSYSGIMDDIKNLALGFGVPMIVGVQASREVETLKLPIPEMHHAQWTSNIEQSSDRVLSLVRPRRYRKEGQTFGSQTVYGYRQLLISTLKQKLGEGNFSEWVLFNPIYNRLDDNEQEVVDYTKSGGYDEGSY